MQTLGSNVPDKDYWRARYQALTEQYDRETISLKKSVDDLSANLERIRRELREMVGMIGGRHE